MSQSSSPSISNNSSSISNIPEDSLPSSQNIHKQKKTIKFLKIFVLVLVLFVVFLVGFLLFGNKVSNFFKGNLTFSSNLAENSILQPILEVYIDEPDGSRVTYQYSDNINYVENLYQQLSSSNGETGPDVITIPDSQVLRFQKYLVPLTDNTMTVKDYIKTFHSIASFELTGIDGLYYAMPLEIDGLLMVYNKDLFNVAGISSASSVTQDWTELLKAAKILSDKLPAGSYAIGIGSMKNVSNVGDLILAIIQQNSTQLIGINGKINLSDEKIVAAISTYTELAKFGISVSESKSDLELFKAGKLAILFTTAAGASQLQGNNFALALTTLPQSVDTERSYIPKYRVAAVTTAARDKLAAWNFVKYLTSNQAQTSYLNNLKKVKGQGGISGRIDLSGLGNDEQVLMTVINMENSFQIPKLANIEELKQELSDAMIAVQEGRKSLEDALKESEANLSKN